MTPKSKRTQESRQMEQKNQEQPIRVSTQSCSKPWSGPRETPRPCTKSWSPNARLFTCPCSPMHPSPIPTYTGMYTTVCTRLVKKRRVFFISLIFFLFRVLFVLSYFIGFTNFLNSLLIISSFLFYQNPIALSYICQCMKNKRSTFEFLNELITFL